MRIVDFSQPEIDRPFMKKTDAWIWVMNIPSGLSTHWDSTDQRVFDLQDTHGCANVISGNSRHPVTGKIIPKMIGVYVYPHGVRHRVGNYDSVGLGPACDCEVKG